MEDHPPAARERCTLCGLPVHYFETAAIDDEAQVCPFCRSFDMLRFEQEEALAEVALLLSGPSHSS